MTNDSYEIYLSYDPEKDNISDSLTFLSEVIKRHEQADAILLDALEAQNAYSKAIMTNIQHSSIKLFISNVISKTHDQNIMESGLKAFWHQFLIQAKEPFLKYTSEHTSLENKTDLQRIKGEVANIAKENNLNPLLIESLSDEKVLDCLKAYSVPSECLSPTQQYTATCNGRTFAIRKDFKVNEDLIKENPRNFYNQELFLIPRKTVYKGDSKWEFVYPKGGQAMKAKLNDKEWLEKFQNNQLSAREFPYPTTVLHVIGDVSITQDSIGSRKEVEVNIKKVYGVVNDYSHKEITSQGSLFD
jgi:hypothetical protein